MKIITILLIAGTMQSIIAQDVLPILKSNTTTIDIREGEDLYTGIWKAAPEEKLDVFVTQSFDKTNQIYFYSDIDTIMFDVVPNKTYNFVILLNGKEKAFTQINTSESAEPSLEPKLKYSRLHKISGENDTIPFIVSTKNRIHINGRINGSEELDIMFDTGAGMCVVVSSVIDNKVKMQIDGNQLNGGIDGVSMVQKSNNNTIEINNLIWEDVPFLSIAYKAPDFDAVLGWVAFENKVVEINYDDNYLIIHKSLIEVADEYTKLDFKLIKGIPYIKCQLVVGARVIEGWFDFDTGSNGELSIGQKFARENLLLDKMKKIGTSSSTGSSGNKIYNDVVLLHELRLGDYEMYQTPLSIEKEAVEGVEHNENIGNNLLKRFNTIIDFKNNHIYLKPNKLLYSSMQGKYYR